MITTTMRALLAAILLQWSSIHLFSDDLGSRHPVEQQLGGSTSFIVAGGGTLDFEQKGDTTTVKLKGKAVAAIEAPQFVSGIAVSEDRSVVALLINKDRGSTMSDYHSVLRLRLNQDGSLTDSARFLPKTHKVMKRLNRWIVKLDSILNDGRTVRLRFGELVEEGDPYMKMRYAMQVRDLETGELYREDPDIRG